MPLPIFRRMMLAAEDAGDWQSDPRDACVIYGRDPDDDLLTSKNGRLRLENVVEEPPR